MNAQMKRSLSTSLYWYVEKSLDDMLDGYMLLVKNIQSLNDDQVAAGTEVNQIITQMLELPLEFDNMSRQLSVNLILASIQRNIKSTKACKYLLVTIMKRKLEIAGILKSDFLMLLEQIFFREVKKDDYLKPEVPLQPLQPTVPLLFEEEDEEINNPRLESRAYAEILVDLYHREIVSATQILVYMEQLSKKEPSYYHTDLLLFLLCKLGSSVEVKLSRGSYNPLRYGGGGSSTPTSSTCSSGNFTGCRATFEGIYKRLESLMPYAISTESQLAYTKILKERKARARSKVRKTRSKDGVKNGSSNKYRSCGKINSNQNGNLSLSTSSSDTLVISRVGPTHGHSNSSIAEHSNDECNEWKYEFTFEKARRTVEEGITAL